MINKLCVTCRAETIERVHEDVTVDACPEGHGVWLDERELLNAVRTTASGEPIGNAYEEGRSLSLAGARDVELDDEVRTCPMCETELGSVRYAFSTDVVVDVCQKHGVWLDAGELDQLEAWAEERAAPDSPESIARAERVHARETEDPEVFEYGVSLRSWLGAILKR